MRNSHISNYSVIKVSGKDNKKFLQGQLTCDLEKLSETQALYGGYANVQGRLISCFYLFQKQDDIFLITTHSTLEPLLATLKKYAIFSKVEFTVTSLHVTAVWGSDHFSNLEQIISQPLSNEALNTHHSESFTVVRTITQASAYLMITEPTHTPSLLKHLSSFSTSVPNTEWSSFLIHNDVCELNEHSIEKFLPSEIGLTKFKGVSFEKGCFMGQEVIARMHYLGKSKKSLKQLTIESSSVQELIPTSRIMDQDGKLAGEIASLSITSQNTADVLAIMLNAKVDSDQFTLESDHSAIVCLGV